MCFAIQHFRPSRHRGISWSPVLFLLGFLAILGTIAYFMIDPMRQVATSATTQQSKSVAAYAALFVCLLLLILLVGMVFSIRLGRLVRPDDEAPKPTNILPDPWEEAGRRAKAPSPQDLEEPENPKNPDNKPSDSDTGPKPPQGI